MSLRMFRDADQQGGFDCLAGQVEGRAVTLLDYDTIYRGMSAAGMTINRQTVVVVDLAVPVIEFRVAPKGWIDKVLQFFGATVITISGQDGFNRRFAVVGEGAEAVQRLFTPHFIAALTEANGTAEVFQGSLVFYRHNQQVKPAEFDGLLEHGMRLARILEGEAS